MKIKGTGIYTDATGRSKNILGIYDLANEENLRELKVSGKVSFEKISCAKVSVSGKCKGDSISAQVVKISGELSVAEVSCDEINISGKCEGKSLSTKNFLGSGKIKLVSLKVEETLKFSGEANVDSVTADEIFIATRNGSIGSIKCRKIKIFDDSERFSGEVFGRIFAVRSSLSKSHLRVQIKNIEADTVDLENSEVEVIRCKDAFIGSNCAIEKLFVAGECKVVADSKVGDIIHM